MLKALQILKEMLEQNQDSDCINELREAIDELEALNSNDNKVKTCEGCKFGKFGIDSLGVEVECSLVWDCSRGRKDEWEPK